MGPTGSGKSTFVNLTSGSNLAVGEGLESCTSMVQACAPFYLDGKRVLLIDTPGFDDSNISDVEVLQKIAEFLAVT
jgi:predicted GTPase